ncbi:MAG: type V CRISPR-associated protein Cas12a/Cpf1 [Candidatus Aenigmarchaeota archaeon]|nr:type V CRISPR-associated protein Cas12a/Cpf1 [Candidatus Aenigmarchaeota archaeon]
MVGGNLQDEKFTNMYSLSKTLRFELKPIGKTLEHIEKKKLIRQDEKRAESYKKMKRTIDGFHRDFIELAMSQVKLTKLKAFAKLYNESSERKKEDDFKKKFEKVQADLRKEIAEGFKTGKAKETFSKIDKKELITELLPNWIRTQEGQNKNIYFDDKFKRFTTYFGGFHENRKNIYTDKEQSTAIAYRLIHENLPRFLDNIKTFEKIRLIPELYKECAILYEEIKEYLEITRINDAFKVDYYNKVLTQKQMDVYNLIIGGRTPKEGQKKIQGLNEQINLYNQKQNKNNQTPKFKQLYKQILSDRESASFLPEAFEESQEVLDSIRDYYQSNLIDYKPDDKDDTENILKKIKDLLVHLQNYDLNKIYLRNNKSITDISKTLFDDWSIIKSALEFAFLQTLEIGKKGLSKKQEKEKEKYLNQSHFSIADIEGALLAYKDEAEILKDLHDDTKPIVNYFHTHFKTEKKKDSDKEFDLIANIEAKYSCIKGILNTEYPKDKKLNHDKKVIDDIKAFLDSLMELLHFVKPLSLPSDSPLEKDEMFYVQFQTGYDQLRLLIPLYNKVRNYATQKPYSTEKFKLNFENSKLLAGWDLNKEADNTSVLFRKNGLYYLGIMDKEHNQIFKNIPDASPGKVVYEKMVYKLLPSPNKMLPKVFFSNRRINEFAPSEELKKKYKAGTHKKGDQFNIKDCRNLIDFFKESITKHEDWKRFGFQFSDTPSYEDLSGFYREVEHQGYKITFQNVPESYINQLVDEGKLFLFKIWNKDFSTYSKGNPNLHTMYWKALFDPKNLKDVVYKLNGQAEMFYRRKSISNDRSVVHKANKPIGNKNPNNTKKESVFEYDIIKDKRYTADKFQFHVPITLNFKAKGNEHINAYVLEYLKNNPEVKIIGLDRGERNLIYLTLIDQQGNIEEQYSLNDIINEHKGNTYQTNYRDLLGKKEDERAKARENWGTIETIKELKEGYISQAIHKIVQMMVKHNAIVVMEDLNFGFKRGRFKVEKQIYQKLEKKLIDKLNYLVFKGKADNEIGGLYHALQLTNKFVSFQKLGKQSGFLFYVPAWNTSKIDPTTGFVNLFNTRYENLEKARSFFNNFEDIRYNPAKDYFEFDVKEYSKFNSKADGTKQDWTICTYDVRIKTFRNPKKNNQWDNKEVVLSDEFKKLFQLNNVDYKTDLKKQIISQTEKTFFETLLNLFKLTVQMRNSKMQSWDDYLISPVMNSKEEFYDSRNAGKEFPQDADANGAYHIAKKGLWALQQISAHNEDWKSLKLTIGNKEWLQFVQEGTEQWNKI